MPRYIVNTPLRSGGAEPIAAGETVEMSAAEAKPLVACGALSPDTRKAAPPPPPPASLPDEAALKALTPVKLMAQGKAEGLELDKAADKDKLVEAILTARKPVTDGGAA